jgi:outer membrane biosynthesis protein TonB
VERTPPPAARAPRAAEGSSSAKRYVLLGGAALLLLGGGAFVVMNLGSSPAPQVATATPPPAVPATQPAAAPSVEPEPSAAEAAPEPEPTAEAAPPQPPPVVEEVIPVEPPAAKPSAAPTPAASRPPSAAPSARPRPGEPTPAATAAAPSAEALRAQQVATLMGQADQAVGAGRHETASSLYDEVLKLDPQNAAATAGKARAQAAVALARRSFVTGRTQVQTEKVDKSLSGFETEDVSLQKAPDFLGKVEFEVSPARVSPGTAYSVKVYVLNQGKKSIRIRGINVGTTVNGTRSPSPASTSVREIDPQQRVLLTEVGGEWQQGTTAWSMDVQVTANRGDSLKSQVTWR